MNPKTEKNPKGAGRVKKAKTKAVFIRVPETDHPTLDKMCREVVKQFYKEKANT